MISIILPTHNRADLLPGAVESVLAQTMEDWELLLVDDGSTDDTPEVIRAFTKQDPRIRSFRNDPNIRLPRALNRGFAEARGEFLTWTSDDNLYYPHALATLFAALESDPKAGLAYSSMALIDEDGQRTGDWIAQAVEAQPIQPWAGACFLYRMEVYKRVGDYDPDMVLAEDLDYWIRVRLQFPMVCVREELYAYRDHPRSLSATLGPKVHEAGAKVVERHLPKIDWLTPTNRSVTLLGLAQAALLRNDRSAAKKWIRQAFRAAPGVPLRTFKRGIVQAFLGR